MRNLFFIGVLLLAGCSGNHEHAGEDHDHEHEEHAAHDHEHEGHAHSHAGEINLTHQAMEDFGVRVSKIQPGDFYTTITTTGEAMPSTAGSGVAVAPVSGTVNIPASITPGHEVGAGTVIATINTKGTAGGDANAIALAELRAAETELARLTPLYESRLVTAAEYNAARSAVDRARAAYSPGAGGNVTAPVSGVITSIDVARGQFVEAGTPVATITSAKSLTLRIDIPRRQARAVTAASYISISLPYSDRIVSLSDLHATAASSTTAPTTGPTAFVPMYYNIPSGTEGLTPGSTFTAYVHTGKRAGVLSVPRTALSEQQGRYFVYRQVHAHSFVKVPVTVGSTDGASVEVLSGIKPGEAIVTSGVTTVRLAENASVVPEGHHHHH